MDDLVAFLRARAADDEKLAKNPGTGEDIGDLLRARARGIRLLIGDSGTPGCQWRPQLQSLAAIYVWHPDYDRAWLPGSQ